MAQVRVQITRGANNVVTFTPVVQAVTSLDDLFWVNNDEQSAHWPAPSASGATGTSGATAWMPAAIPIKQSGQPAPASRGIAFDPPSTTGSYALHYVCVLHPTEKGTINVKS
jgi:hypothetical protein